MIGAIPARISTPGRDVVTVDVRRYPRTGERVVLTVKGLAITLTEENAINLANLISDAIDSFAPTPTPTPEGDTPS